MAVKSTVIRRSITDTKDPGRSLPIRRSRPGGSLTWTVLGCSRRSNLWCLLAFTLVLTSSTLWDLLGAISPSTLVILRLVVPWSQSAQISTIGGDSWLVSMTNSRSMGSHFSGYPLSSIRSRSLSEASQALASHLWFGLMIQTPRILSSILLTNGRPASTR